jgi:1-deoxy-D-xylulose-5-phosphate reductoisomerase
MKEIAILGSTGSIGSNTLDVVRNFPREFKVFALSTNTNIDILFKQIRKFSPPIVCVKDSIKAQELKKKLGKARTKVLVGEEGLEEIVSHGRVNRVVLAISGAIALRPLLKAITHKKDIAMANKEALVMAGPLIMKEVRAQKINLIPIDSEQSAIWQCILGQDKKELKNIYLTASGGPLRNRSLTKLRKITIKEVLRHPCWKMGKKVTIDSATLMNKGLEVLEAMSLFGVSAEKIKIVIHPEAVIHSMVEFIDNVILAQLSATDMRIPIRYALAYPKRLKVKNEETDLYKLGPLNFYKPDFNKFPCLKLAYQAAVEGGVKPCILNAANEASVEAFLKNRISFLDIPRVIEKSLSLFKNIKNPDLNDILEADFLTRIEADNLIERMAN